MASRLRHTSPLYLSAFHLSHWPYTPALIFVLYAIPVFVASLHRLFTHVLTNVCIMQDFAYESTQKYKEGKYILERNLLVEVQ